MNIEQMWMINDCLHQPDRPGSSLRIIKLTWLQMTSQRLPFASSCKTPIKTFERITNRMSTSSESHTSSSDSDEYPFITATELSHLLLDHGMNFAISNAFSASPLSTALLQNYLFLSQNIDRILLDINWNDNPFCHYTPFQDTITPILLNF